MLETAIGVGMCVGPAVGVWLYEVSKILGYFIHNDSVKLS